MYCKNCGQQIDDKAVVCIHCGVATKEPVQQAQQPVVNVVNMNTNTVSGGIGYIHKKNGPLSGCASSLAALALTDSTSARSVQVLSGYLPLAWVALAR